MCGGSQGVWHALYDHEDANYTVADVTVVALKHPAEYTTVMIPHSIERIDLFGPHVFVDGHITPNGLSASILNLRPVPTVTSSIFLNDVVETEDRSHAYNTRLHRDGSGLIGLPTIVRSEYLQDHETSTNLHFFRVDANLNLEVAGILQGDSRTVSPGYACEVSCTDWYGVSRPIFPGHRIFTALRITN